MEVVELFLPLPICIPRMAAVQCKISRKKTSSHVFPKQPDVAPQRQEDWVHPNFAELLTMSGCSPEQSERDLGGT